VNDRQIKALDKRLGDFVNRVTADMGRSERRRWAEVYLRGLLLDGERKSIEPLALRVGGDVQALQQFVGQSPWAAEKVMEALNKHMTSAVAEGTYWIRASLKKNFRFDGSAVGWRARRKPRAVASYCPWFATPRAGPRRPSE
jgi:SRSO17 transposase